MTASAFVLLGARAGPADIPTVSICTTGSSAGKCYDMPVVGQGSCCGAYNISTWLSQGGVHIDTSCDYGSQPTISQAVQASGIPRSKLWITSKLNVESCGLDMAADLQSLVLAPLQMEYVDLLLLHHAGRWETDRNPHPPCFDASAAGPAGNGTYYSCRMQTVQAMEKLVAGGKVRTWGVSNWQVRDLQQMHDVYGYYPAINQIEYHVSLPGVAPPHPPPLHPRAFAAASVCQGCGYTHGSRHSSPRAPFFPPNHSPPPFAVTAVVARERGGVLLQQARNTSGGLRTHWGR